MFSYSCAITNVLSVFCIYLETPFSSKRPKNCAALNIL